MYRTDDPIADFMRRDAEQQEWLDKRPVCGFCKEPIQEERAFFYAGEWFCTNEYCEKDFIREFWNDIREDYIVRVEG